MAESQAKEYVQAGPGHSAPYFAPLPESLATSTSSSSSSSSSNGAAANGSSSSNGGGGSKQHVLLKERHPVRPPVQHR